jgi:hypothetical protein
MTPTRKNEPDDLAAWLQAAAADADRRGLPELKPLLETLGKATAALRAADFNDNATAPAGERAPR